MRPSIWPDWLETDEQTALLAKSLERSIGDRPETLAEHTWAVLERLSEFIRLRPNLPDVIEVPHLWNTLFWSAFLHDFGKAAAGFQDRLRGGEKWPHRHEVLSLAFVDWIARDLPAEEKTWLVAAIVSHHKDIHLIRRNYNRHAREQVADLIAQLNETALRGLWQWLKMCPASWLEALGLAHLNIRQLSLLPEDEAVSLVQNRGVNSIYRWLGLYFDFFEDEIEFNPAPALTIGTLTLRGYLTNADHSASAHRGSLPTVTIDADAILQSRNIAREQLYNHQLEAEQVEGSILLTAPTGSGKTEAALLWAAQQTGRSSNQPRLFYTLPYQASMNAMWLRLSEIFGKDERENDLVGLQHGRSLLAHYWILQENEDDDANPNHIARQVKLARNMAELNYPPIRVFSPYQMLKGPYRLRGYEKLLSDYHQALFIFDEIHAYEPERLALILETIKYLRLNFGARFIVMSATFPQLINEVLIDALGTVSEIKADEALFEADRFQRHRLRLKDGELLNGLDEIAHVAESGKSALVACNRVAVAQAAYDHLRERLSETINVALLHGKFNMRDRAELEKTVRQCAGADVENPQPFVLVATQAVEVSLDIDLDTIYTEPAPLDALVQRFGRVNRRGKKGLTDVHVFRDCDWDRQKWVYATEIVEATLKVLEREKDQPINENKIGGWLDEIYTGEIAEAWHQEYEKAAKTFTDVWLKNLRAFEAITDKREQEFYDLFDGLEVLPRELVHEYEALKDDGDFIEASALLVPIRYGQWQALHFQRKDPHHFEGGWPWVVDLPYSSQFGLDMSRYREAPEGGIAIA